MGILRIQGNLFLVTYKGKTIKFYLCCSLTCLSPQNQEGVDGIFRDHFYSVLLRFSEYQKREKAQCKFEPFSLWNLRCRNSLCQGTAYSSPVQGEDVSNTAKHMNFRLRHWFSLGCKKSRISTVHKTRGPSMY